MLTFGSVRRRVVPCFNLLTRGQRIHSGKNEKNNYPGLRIIAGH